MNIKHNFDWEKLIKKQKESGLNAINFCKQHNLPYQTFLTHRRNTETKVLSLVPVVIKREEVILNEVVCNGMNLKISNDVSVTFLEKLLLATER